MDIHNKKIKSVVFFSNKRLNNKSESISNLIDHFNDKKILVVDFNPQCETTGYLLHEEDYSNENDITVLDIMKDDLEINSSVVKKSSINVDVILGSLLLEEYLYIKNIEFNQSFHSAVYGRSDDLFNGYLKLFYFLEKINELTHYDIIIFDTNEIGNALNSILIHYCDLHVYPLYDESYLSISFLQQFERSYDRWQYLNRRIDTGGENKVLKGIPNTVVLIENPDVKLTDPELIKNIKIVNNDTLLDLINNNII